ncbi:MAG: SLBB domain-containing protein [Sporichthyaceae bacterium]
MTGWPMWTVGEPRLLAGLDQVQRIGLDEHRRLHGHLPTHCREAWEDLAAATALLGRGGAGFPVVRKLAAIPAGGAYAVVVNGSESEPLSVKDRTLMRRTPHLVVDGALGLAGALRARVVTVAVHDPESASSMRAAVRERRDARRVRVVVQPEHFVAGEARAVIRHASGGPALPPGRRTLPSDDGLHGRPTFLSNAETFAQLAVLAKSGPRVYAERGVAEEPGTSLLTVTGAVRRPGVVEVPNGVPLSIILEAAGGEGESAVLMGGYHGAWVPPGSRIVLSRPALQRSGLSFGAGVVAVVGPDSCPLGEVELVAQPSGYSGMRRSSPGEVHAPTRTGSPGSSRRLWIALAPTSWTTHGTAPAAVRS